MAAVAQNWQDLEHKSVRPHAKPTQASSILILRLEQTVLDLNNFSDITLEFNFCFLCSL